MQTDRRLEPRKPIAARGVLFGSSLETGCLIVDQSMAGARVRLERAVALPTAFLLIDIARGTAHEARSAWTKGNEVGLRLSNPVRLAGLTPARLTPARQAWLRNGGH